MLVFWRYFLTLSSTSYISCTVDTSCKQNLRLALSEDSTSSTTEQNNTRYPISHCILHCNRSASGALVLAYINYPAPASSRFPFLQAFVYFVLEAQWVPVPGLSGAQETCWQAAQSIHCTVPFHACAKLQCRWFWPFWS